MLALLDDKIQRFNQTADHDELLGIVVDTLVAFTVAAKRAGLLVPQSSSELSPDFENPPKKRMPMRGEERMPEHDAVATILPGATEAGEVAAVLNPCPRCDQTDVKAGAKTKRLPDAVCETCELDLPPGELDVQDYITWIQVGADRAREEREKNATSS